MYFFLGIGSMVKAHSGRSANTISCVSSHLLFWRRVLKKISCSCTLHIKAPFSPLNYVFCTGIYYSYTMPGFSLCVMQMCCSAKTFLLIIYTIYCVGWIKQQQHAKWCVLDFKVLTRMLFWNTVCRSLP